MTLFRDARAALQEIRANPEDPSYPLTSATLVELFAGGKTSAGVYVSEASAHKVIAVYRAWALLAGTIGSLPLQTFTGEPPGGERWSGDQAFLLQYPGGRDAVSGLPTLGATPGPVFWETLGVHLLTWGNAYVVKIPNVVGNRVVALDLLLPNKVQPRWARKTEANPAGKEFVVIDDDGTYMVATPRDVIHIRAMGGSLLQGLSPIGAARQALGLAVAAEEYGAKLFGSGNLMAGILQTDQKLQEPDAERLKQRWKAKMHGLANAHDIAVLDSGAKWQQIGIPPEDSQFLQTREFAVTEVARLYGIPPHMLGQVEKSTSWGTGIEQQGLGFNIYTLRPWLSRIEATLSNELLPRGVNCRFNVTELLRGDIKTRYEAYQLGINSGFMSPADARDQEGLPFVAGSNELMFPLNYGSLKNVVDPPAQPVQEPAVSNPGGQRMSSGREQRRVALDSVEIRADVTGDEIRVDGHAAVFERTAWIGPPQYGFSERFAKGAFAKTISDGADIRYLFNHDPNAILARTKSGTLKLSEDRTGLAVDANLAPTTVGRDLAILMERGDVNQMSIGFEVVRDQWEEVRGDDGNTYERRTVFEAKLYDVSAVTYPAYEGTDAGLRAAELARELRDARGQHVQRRSDDREPPTSTPDTDSRGSGDPSTPAVEVPVPPVEPATATPADGEDYVEERSLPLHELLLRHAAGSHAAAPRALCPACTQPATATA